MKVYACGLDLAKPNVFHNPHTCPQPPMSQVAIKYRNVGV